MFRRGVCFVVGDLMFRSFRRGVCVDYICTSWPSEIYMYMYVCMYVCMYCRVFLSRKRGDRHDVSVSASPPAGPTNQ